MSWVSWVNRGLSYCSRVIMHTSPSLSEVFSVDGNYVVTRLMAREFSTSFIISTQNFALFLIMPPTRLIDQIIIQQNPLLPPPHLHRNSFLCPVDVGFGHWDSAWPSGTHGQGVLPCSWILVPATWLALAKGMLLAVTELRVTNYLYKWDLPLVL